MRNDIQGKKSISIYSANGYEMVKYFSFRTLNPAPKNRRFLAKIKGGQAQTINDGWTLCEAIDSGNEILSNDVQ